MSFFILIQALNQLFEKIMALDIEERHLLRLGHGEEALETEKDFSRYMMITKLLFAELANMLKEFMFSSFLSGRATGCV